MSAATETMDPLHLEACDWLERRDFGQWTDADQADFETWLAGRSTKFRGETRRYRRRLEEAGAEFRTVGAAERGPALDALLALHERRWRDRGGSQAMIPGLREMLDEAGEASKAAS